MFHAFFRHLRALLPVLLLAPQSWSGAAAAPGAWRDPATGFAIGGFDPVSYFTQGKPVQGSEGVELKWRGAVWRFRNTGNRDAFAKHPQVYAPAFAGYDPLSLSRGLTVQGLPAVWARHEGHIYLFSDISHLREWRGNPNKYNALGQANWLRLGKELPGTSER